MGGGEGATMQEIKRPELTFPKSVADFVTDAYRKAGCILEYGSGGSTVMASEMRGKEVYSVESDRTWAENLRKYLSQSPNTLSKVEILHADIGPTGAWGHPTNSDQWPKFVNYPLRPWVAYANIRPDVVLIDGRFRAACFLVSLLMTEKDALFIFDDYKGRESYRVVEEFVEPDFFVGRMAAFRVAPTSLNRSKLAVFVASFFSKS